MSACLLNLIDEKASPAAHDSSEVAHCYPHTGSGGHSLCLSSSLALSIGFSTQDEAIRRFTTMLMLGIKKGT